MNRVFGPLLTLTLAVAGSADAQELDAGARFFKQRCQACHSLTPGKNSPAGPNLVGVVGRASAATDFKYSAALKASGLTWDVATLDQFLAAPAKLVPGTRMAIGVPNGEQRKEIIAYLASVTN
ncbi:cytochrome C [Pararhizobium antarcticum]|uniref:Cytochrome C n=2 Tax=Pararhizobium antarcticum TaxID=1798805 RepID=A0A657LQR0_9HYPH|nr:cytochrome C [Rhizobium sp. 58]OJF94086.1 cytochrome C [Pararhizobium antarcticum]